MDRRRRLCRVGPPAATMSITISSRVGRALRGCSSYRPCQYSIDALFDRSVGGHGSRSPDAAGCDRRSLRGGDAAPPVAGDGGSTPPTWASVAWNESHLLLPGGEDPVLRRRHSRTPSTKVFNRSCWLVPATTVAPGALHARGLTSSKSTIRTRRPTSGVVLRAAARTTCRWTWPFNQSHPVPPGPSRRSPWSRG